MDDGSRCELQSTLTAGQCTSTKRCFFLKPFSNGLVTVMVPQLRRENSLLLWNVFDLNTPVHTFVGHDDVVLEFQWRKQKEGEIRAGLSALSPALLPSAFHGSWLRCSCCHLLTLAFPWSSSSLLSCPCLLLFPPPSYSCFPLTLSQWPQKHCPVVSMLTKQIQRMLSGSAVTLIASSPL